MSAVIEALTDAEAHAFLDRQVVGRVGCHLDGQTYVVPVIYAWDGDCVYVQSIEGQKIEMMRANPRVCFEVDEYRSGGGWRSVIVDGTYEEMHGDDASAALALLVRRFSGTPVGHGERRHSDRAPVAFRIRPERTTGRRVGRLSGNGASAHGVAAALRRAARRPSL